MPNTEKRQWSPEDLIVIKYLDQRLAFDLLATIEDGFSFLTTTEYHSQGANSTTTAGEAGISLGGLSSLFGISLGAKASRGTSDTNLNSSTESAQRTHTWGSLFVRLRRELRNADLVASVSSSKDITLLSEGQFVEFEGTLHRHQLTELLEMVEAIAPMMNESSQPRNKGGKNTNRNQQQNQSIGAKQIAAMKSIVSGGGAQDLIAKVGEMHIVVTVDVNSFFDPKMNDVLDGKFKVFGKVTRVVSDPSDSINLMRRSMLGKIKGGTQIATSLADLDTVEFEPGTTEADITGPTFQVIPIAIYV